MEFSPTRTPYDPTHLTFFQIDGETRNFRSAEPAALADAKLALVLLGTGAGQSFNPGRTGMSALLVVDGVPYLVDAGWGAARRIQQSGINPLEIRAGFVTHMHADHIADLWNMFLWKLHSSAPEHQIQIFGPGEAGFWEAPKQELPVVGESRIGVKQYFEYAQLAYGADLNNTAGEFGNLTTPVPNSIVGVDIAPVAGADPDHPAPAMDPMPIYEDERVRVSAQLVAHGPVYPAYGFRFETAYGSVAFSGDTSVHENVDRLAQGADVLVHEAIDVEYYKAQGVSEAGIKHHLETHTRPADVGALAQRTKVGRVVLAHLGPGSSEAVSDETWRAKVAEQYSGPIHVGNDLQVLALA